MAQPNIEDPFADAFTLDEVTRQMIRDDLYIRMCVYNIKRLRGDLICGVGNPVEVNRQLVAERIKLRLRRRVVIGAARGVYCRLYHEFLRDYRGR